ncbi:sensor domain-containing diguanylate cyclase [Leeia oryzae]|uniref:sensor domain-containing diguanylate cyclase n=1 Tax=Leeia oryzae TaxID=356662 RepID=UPI000377CFDA|nr:sensor domain-containing diguanylate cyclase [Leeia oryzae]
MQPHNPFSSHAIGNEVVDLVSTPILVCQPLTGEIIYRNAAARQQLADIETTQMEKWFERPTDWRELLLRLKNQGQLKHFEARFKGTHGRVVWMVVSAKTLVHDQQTLIMLTLFDMTEYRKREYKHQTDEALHLQILRCSSEGYLQFDTDSNRIIDANPAMCELLKCPHHHLVGTSLTDFLDTDSRDALLAQTDWASRQGTLQEELHLVRKDGSRLIVQANANALKDENDEVITAFALLTDITERKKTEERMLYLAFYDPLTALPNRLLFQERLQQALFQQSRYGAPFSLLFLDLDNFKQINDTLGHDVGDALLKQIAKRLFNAVRESDTVSRIGGDEFLIILHGISSSKEAEIAAQKLLDALKTPINIGQHALQASVSIGVTLVPQDGTDATTLRKKADLAMYQAKAAGKNTYSLYSEADSSL